MPHFIIDCSVNILKLKEPETIIKEVYDVAKSTELFNPHEIKVRIHTYEYYNTGNTKDDFIHVFANIMEGRTNTQKSDLLKKIVRKLTNLFPDVPVISMNIRDFEKATYCNKEMV